MDDQPELMVAGADRGLRAAGLGDLGTIAGIHQRAFPDSVLTRLGEQAVVGYYRWLLTGPHEAVFLVHTGSDDGGIHGFVVGGYFQDAMGGFVARNLPLLAGRLLVRPRLTLIAVRRRRVSVAIRSLTKLARSMTLARLETARRGSEVSGRPAVPASRLYRCLALAVSPDQEGRGVGRSLMTGLTAAAAAGGVHRMQLGVNPNNRRAVRFYELQGWTRMSQYTDWFEDTASPVLGAGWWGLMERIIGRREATSDPADVHAPSVRAIPDESASPQDAVAIVVVVRDRLSTFPACLEALFAHTETPFHVIVVVGGADDDTRDYLARLARRHGNLRAILRDAPLSAGAARKVAIPQLTCRRCVLMENDTIVHAGWLRPLLDCAVEECAAVVTPLVLWHGRIHAAGCSLERFERNGTLALRHSIEYRDVRRKRIGYAETHCMLVDLKQLTTADLCDHEEPTDVDFGLTLNTKGCTTFLEPRSVVTYAAPPPLEMRDITHSLQRWNLKTWEASNARFMAKWNLEYDASAKQASYQRQELRLALVRHYPTAVTVAVTNLCTRVMNRFVTSVTSGRARRTFG